MSHLRRLLLVSSFMRPARLAAFLAAVACPGGFPSGADVYGQGQESAPAPAIEFSASVVRRVEGRTLHAQLFVKRDRYRLEHQGGIRTDLGYAGVSIVRLDKQEVWLILSQRRQFLAVPLRSDHWLPLTARLDDEMSRVLLGNATAAGRPAQLFEVTVARAGKPEVLYEWMDKEHGVPLKLVSKDRDWSIEYQQARFSPQPDHYFEVPRGYTRWKSPRAPQEKG